MRPYATVLLVACCAVTLVGCGGRHRRNWCPFGDRFHRGACVEREKWDRCDDDFDNDDDCDECCPCHGHGGHMMPQYSTPMQSFDSGCGCDGGMSMPGYYGGGMPMSFDSYPQPGGCSSCGGGGMMSAPMMSAPSYPTFDQSMMMGTPMPQPTPTPTPATPPIAPAAESYYSPKGSGAQSATTVPPRY